MRMSRKSSKAGQGPRLSGVPARAGNPLWPWLALALIGLLLDQFTKLLVLRRFVPGERLALIDGWLDLTLVYNTGAAFSFLAGAGGWQRWFFVGVAVVASIAITWMLARHGQQKLFGLALALILSGAIGNVIDRLAYGKVVDFVLVHWHEKWFFPAFNVADSAITIGAILLILDELLRVRRSR
jgi:signal peptidase II